MTRIWKHLLALGILAGLGVVIPMSLGQQAPGRGPGQPAAGRGQAAAPAYKSEEYLLLGNSTRGAGEPMIAVDPTNPKNMIVTAMGSLQQAFSDGKPMFGSDFYHRVAYSTITWLGVTHDGGISWEVKELPILSGKLKRCPDAIADVTKDGIFIAGCEPRETDSIEDYWGESAFMMSTDKGKTWGPKVAMISDFELKRFAPGLKPVSGGWPAGSPNKVASNSPWDRPFTFIDDSTGVIYGMAGGGKTEDGAEPGKTRSQSYITASTDGGKSFGTVYSWDSKDYPQSSRGIGMSAAHGVVAVTYVASKAPNETCPCPVFGLSRDQGKTFTYHVLKNIKVQASSAAAGPGGGGNPTGLTDISADQTKAGRFAMLLYENTAYSVAISEDYGQTWGPFVTAGTVPGATNFSKPAFEFSRDGVIGLMWRAIYPDGSYDIWASISRDSGKTFSKSLKVSHARSPSLDPIRNSGRFGDDIQDLSMDKQNIHMVWGDSRSGFLGTWYGRVAFSDFEF